MVIQGVACLWHEISEELKGKRLRLFHELQQQLCPHLPDGFFVEAALLRLEPSGIATFAGGRPRQAVIAGWNGPACARAATGRLPPGEH